MALTIPVLAPVPYFDASNAQTFTFAVRGGEQVLRASSWSILFLLVR